MTPTFASIERIGQGYGLSSALFRCRLQGDGGPPSIVVKLWSTDGPAGTHEVLFYASFAPELGIRVPVCHYGAIDQERSRGVLVLEDLEGAIQGDCLRQLDAGSAATLADTLAALHATWWEHARLGESDWLPFVADRPVGWLTARRDQFLDRFGDRVVPTIRRLLKRIEPVQSRASERLSGAPRTLLHGDLHLDNVVFGGQGQPVLLDWARVSQGPAVLDLADLLFAMASPGEARSLLAAYRRGLVRRGIGRLDDRSIRDQLGGALLRKLISSTCGMARWLPSSEREQLMITVGFDRVAEAIEYWRRVDPKLFEL